MNQNSIKMYDKQGSVLRVETIKGTHRYQLTAQGRRTLPAFIAARNANALELNKLAA